MGELSNRRGFSAQKIEQLRSGLKSAEKLIAGNACVYVTGSFGRGEASSHSDLDLFIIGKGKGRRIDGVRRPSKLSRLDGICITSELIQITRRYQFPEFSGDGRWLVQYSEDDLITTLGTQDDDAENTFTARLLLLLESQNLLGRKIYSGIIKSVIKAYWRDYNDHRSNFMPAFLANDILRLWRTLCVNYEATTKTMPDIAKAKRRLKNYKLKHSRLLTCYSGILELLHLYDENGTVHPEDAVQIVTRTPTERLEHLASSLTGAHDALVKLLTQYEGFLDTTNRPEKELIEEFIDKEKSKEYMKGAKVFGDLMYDVMFEIGRGSEFYRLLVV